MAVRVWLTANFNAFILYLICQLTPREMMLYCNLEYVIMIAVTDLLTGPVFV